MFIIHSAFKTVVPYNPPKYQNPIFAGRVAINTEQGSEALTVHGNIQVSSKFYFPIHVTCVSQILEIGCVDSQKK